MVSHDEPTPKKMKGTNQPKKRKIEQVKTDPSEDGRTYGIGRLNLGKSVNAS